MMRDVQAGALAPDAIEEDTLASYLTTAGMPDPDLLIRPGGESRLSNFLLYQVAYAELVLRETFWPDFGARRVRRGDRRVPAPPAAVRRTVTRARPRRPRAARRQAAPAVSARRIVIGLLLAALGFAAVVWPPGVHAARAR